MQVTPIAFLPLEGWLLILIATVTVVNFIRWAGGKWSHERSGLIATILEGVVIASAFYSMQAVPVIAWAEAKLISLEHALPVGLEYWGLGLLALGLAIWGWMMYDKSRKGSLKKKAWMLLFGLAMLQLGLSLPPLGFIMGWVGTVAVPFLWNLFVGFFTQIGANA